ncbi:MAG: lipid-A-disaccharide synthase-related protein [Jaaginema sp. PMC 1079.18]|nr:lipid-A-disaccharide synthase-related protein [Jaaginema sp. PMC 1080.18]MEC4850281.1 lipid-A-disaccharide synthase-related protein [Jaaginema sp. PMC 1079.18]MEC4867396.1 lipid-A-disaccharide synthase-related protein [Jaaginema sp. PMC 1078.18]
MKLLCISNGHGEDAIAIRILEQLQILCPTLEIAALPLVGEGQAYRSLEIPIVGQVKTMPSGGFIYMDSKQLLGDVKGGLLRLTWEQYKAVKHWAKTAPKDSIILAVGDFVPLLFAWLSGLPYAFVGTAKSEYYLRNEMGWLSPQAKREGWAGSVYYPWERWLMRHKRCKGVFPRDSLTAKTLQRWCNNIFDLGNPMMDGLEAPPRFHPGKDEEDRLLTILLLPGSRSPEAYQNWQVLLAAVHTITRQYSRREILFFAAIAPSLDLEPLSQALIAENWQKQENNPILDDPEASTWQRDHATLVLSQQAYHQCLHQSDFAIAMAGTATEQFVGLGKPAIAIPGDGPQYTYAFAEAQSRLLGPSLILAQTPQKAAQSLEKLLRDPDRLQLIAENGRQRLGEPGAAHRIAKTLQNLFYI